MKFYITLAILDVLYVAMMFLGNVSGGGLGAAKGTQQALILGVVVNVIIIGLRIWYTRRKKIV
ncbi:MAG: hypothetical protein K0S38_937 [Candidatus Paceibacter sp.]|jgi:hypothetical protein|nr:hypothetical protein [Candidatus Paceibacter sp.]